MIDFRLTARQRELQTAIARSWTTRSTSPATVKSLEASLMVAMFAIPEISHWADTRGRWVAQDQRGLCGGLFVSRVEAIRCAMFESGRQPQAVITVPGVLEFDTTRGCAPASRHVKRRAA